MISSAFNLSTSPASPVSLSVSPAAGDAGAVVLGGGFRLPSVKTVPVADKSSLTIGGGFRISAERTAPVTGRPSVSIGGGFRMVKAKHTV